MRLVLYKFLSGVPFQAGQIWSKDRSNTQLIGVDGHFLSVTDFKSVQQGSGNCRCPNSQVMSVCLSMCVCVSVLCMCVCLFVRLYLYVHIFVHIYTYVQCVRAYVQTYIYVRVRTYVGVCMCVCMYVCCMYVCLYVCMYVCMYECVCVCMYVLYVIDYRTSLQYPFQMFIDPERICNIDGTRTKPALWRGEQKLNANNK